MSIAVDQTRLRRITENILAGSTLGRTEVVTILEIAQLAAGVEPTDDPTAHATLQAVAQHVGSAGGLKPGELQEIPRMPDEARGAYLGSLASQLDTRAARELAYAVAFLVSVADLRLTPDEKTALEAFQHALGLDHRRATDLVVLVSETVAAAA
jgi:hypothetical protein